MIPQEPSQNPKIFAWGFQAAYGGRKVRFDSHNSYIIKTQSSGILTWRITIPQKLGSSRRRFLRVGTLLGGGLLANGPSARLPAAPAADILSPYAVGHIMLSPKRPSIPSKTASYPVASATTMVSIWVASTAVSGLNPTTATMIQTSAPDHPNPIRPYPHRPRAKSEHGSAPTPPAFRCGSVSRAGRVPRRSGGGNGMGKLPIRAPLQESPCAT